MSKFNENFIKSIIKSKDKEYIFVGCSIPDT